MKQTSSRQSSTFGLLYTYYSNLRLPRNYKAMYLLSLVTELKAGCSEMYNEKIPDLYPLSKII